MMSLLPLTTQVYTVCKLAKYNGQNQDHNGTDDAIYGHVVV